MHEILPSSMMAGFSTRFLHSAFHTQRRHSVADYSKGFQVSPSIAVATIMLEAARREILEQAAAPADCPPDTSRVEICANCLPRIWSRALLGLSRRLGRGARDARTRRSTARGRPPVQRQQGSRVTLTGSASKCFFSRATTIQTTHLAPLRRLDC